eukprot:CAMPEP_0114996846 /NCGR_PEP_ID=MMETSP0216-20121206/14559_1 /TAXON_ID=223996 /ORGANISM="Protocruzia adherens, Strain Boccale" /LENGTH=244 /DNA_ID=CAMNT_0002361139 /DNA_START=135 /DNA_END=869 /DNA_ORIENTATION=-
MANGVTTQWDDIQRRLGNLPELEKEETLEELTQVAIEVAEKYDPLENRKLEELDELEDDYEDDFLAQYRAKRMKEMKDKAAKPHFGSLLEISKEDWTKEINEAPKDVFVVVHLYQDSVVECRVLNEIFHVLAQRHQLVKFLRIVATRAVEKWQDDMCPTLFIYKDGEMFKQMVGAGKTLGGKKMNVDTVEWVLSQMRIVETELLDDPRPGAEKMMINSSSRQKEDYESDSDDDGREYMSNQIRR